MKHTLPCREAELRGEAFPSRAWERVGNQWRVIAVGSFAIVAIGIADVLFPVSAAAQTGKNGPHTFRGIGQDEATGRSLAVVVDNVPLVHTTQVLTIDRQGKLVPPARQVEQVLDNLGRVLDEAGSHLDHAVKLNVYVAHSMGVRAVEASLAERYRGKTKPAVSFVATPLPGTGAKIAADAVAALMGKHNPERVKRSRSEAVHARPGMADVALLPAGRAVYISGQAEGGDLAIATKETMQGLFATLKHLGLSKEHVVQIKAFMHPMAHSAFVEREISSFYHDELTPPVSLVEWIASSPIEIEMVAWHAGGPSEPRESDTVRYVTPPGMSASPVFSRVAIVDGGKRVYVSGLVARNGGSPDEQVRDIFDLLKSSVEEAGSDMRHLVKGTYYVTDNETSERFGKVRLEVYDPKRPPAASKANVKSVGFEGRTLSLDMIAVTRE